jgi:competence protein ComEC
MLLDGGGSAMYDVGTNTVLPYLHRRGIRSLSMLLNSHPDDDHLQGLESVAEEMPIQLIAIPQSLTNSEEYNSLKQTAVRKKITLQGLSTGQEIRIEEGLKITVLHPGGETYLQNNNNNQSLVLRISYGDFSILLTGDIEKEAMQSLLAEGALNNTTIVKVPHHGSKGSLLPEFYQELQARYAVISVGNNNLFGHPNPATLAMLEEANLRTLRTDQNGAIIILSDGQSMQIKPTIAAK